MAAITIPTDTQAETALLSLCFLSKVDAELVVDCATDKLFTQDVHRETFKAISAAVNQGQAPDTVEVRRAITAAGIEPGQAIAFLSGLMSEPVTSEPQRLIRILEDCRRRRKILELGNYALTKAQLPSARVDDIVAELQRAVYEIDASDGGADGVCPFDVLVERVGEQLEHIQQTGEAIGIKTGFYDLDRVMVAMQKGNLYILAARPGMGKTALAMQVGTNAAKAGHPVGVFSMEMEAEALAMRAICAEGGVPFDRALAGRLNTEDWQRFTDDQARLYALPVHVDDSAALHHSELARRIRKFRRIYGIELAIVDYLQLARGDHADNRVVEVGSISSALKTVAKEAKLPVLALSQLSRACEKRPDKRPQLSDLRDSGVIEQDADAVIGMYRPSYYEADASSATEVIVLKHRNGQTGMIRLGWSGPTMRFFNHSNRDDAR